MTMSPICLRSMAKRTLAAAAVACALLPASTHPRMVVLSPEKGLSPSALAIDARGRIVVGGTLVNRTDRVVFAVGRLSTRGRVDRSFGAGASPLRSSTMASSRTSSRWTSCPTGASSRWGRSTRAA